MVLLAVLFAACGGVEGQPSLRPASSEVPVAASPAVAPKLVALSGTGSKVISPVHLGSAMYRVSWTATGHDNFIVTLHGNGDALLINVIPPSPASGEAFVRSAGGDFAVEVEAATLAWTLTFTPL